MAVENIDWDDEKLYSDKNIFAFIRNILIHSIKDNYLKRVDDGTWEEAGKRIEYYSPNQHGSFHGTVYRQYFSEVLPTELKLNNIVIALIDFRLYAHNDVNRYVVRGAYNAGNDSLLIKLEGTSGTSNLRIYTHGVFSPKGQHLKKGWVDYTRI